MRKKGLTLVELLISIVILGIIFSATASLFSVAIKNYQVSSTQAVLQRETNLAVDNITREIKQSIEIPENYVVGRSPTVLILALPSIDENENFIYDGSSLEKDYITYSLDGTNLHKTVSANLSSTRSQKNGTDKIVLSNISSLEFTYILNSPGMETTQVNLQMTVSKTVSNTTILIDIDNSAIKRNYE